MVILMVADLEKETDGEMDVKMVVSMVGLLADGSELRLVVLLVAMMA